MKSFHLPVLITLSAVLLSACSLFSSSTSSGVSSTETEQDNGNRITDTITSLKDALLSGVDMQCTYDMEGQQATSYISGQKVRVDGITSANQPTSSMINDGTTLYTWSEETKAGMKFDLATMEGLTPDETNQQAQTWRNPQAWAEEIDTTQDVDCSPTVVSDSMFVPPADVTFQDLSAVMESTQKMVKDLQDNPDFQQMQEQLQNINVEQ